MIRIIHVRWTSWRWRNRSYSSRWMPPRRKSDRTRRSSGTAHWLTLLPLLFTCLQIITDLCNMHVKTVRNPWLDSLSNCWPTSWIFFNAMKKIVTPLHFNVNGNHRICYLLANLNKCDRAKLSLGENDTVYCGFTSFFSNRWIPLLCIIFFFSALKKRETNDLKKLEERESELYNIKSELKNTKDNLAEKNKQMTGRCDNDYSTDEQLIK